MAIQRLNFGTAAPNDGEFGRTAFPKLDSNDAYLEGLISAHETRIDDLETDVTAGVPSGTSGYALIGNGVGNATTFQGFTQAGTGAVTRTWQEKMRESVSVLDYIPVAYHAAILARTSTQDVTSCVQAAIDYVLTLGGGRVHFPKGTYYLPSTTSLDPGAGNITFSGDGMNASIFKFNEGTSGSKRYLFKNTANTAKGSLVFKDIQFLGTLSTTAQRAGNPLWLDYYSSVVLDGCRWYDCGGEAMDFHYCGKLRAFNNEFENISADGIRARDTRDIVISGNNFRRIGDDSIALHTNATTLASFTPQRERIIVAHNTIVNGGPVKIIGAKKTLVASNAITLANLTAISVIPANPEGENPQYDIIIADNTITDTRQVISATPATPIAHIVIITVQAVGSAATHSALPYRWDSTDSTVIRPWDWNQADGTDSADAMPPTAGISIRDNVFRRTLPSVAAYSSWGYGSALFQGVSYDPAMDDTDMRPSFAIWFGTVPSFFGVTIEGNRFEHVVAGINLPPPVTELDLYNIAIRNNTFFDITARGVLIDTAAKHANVLIEGNEFDLDYFRVSSNSNTDGTYDASSPPNGIDTGNCEGVIIRGNTFKNCSRLVASNVISTLTIEDNIAYCGTPTATGFNVANKGIGHILTGYGQWRYIIADCDPTSATYGEISSQMVTSASAMPSSGWYYAGWIVWDSAPSTANGRLGWIRLTSGTGHVLNTDWIELGTVRGPGSATDNALARFDATTGKLIQNSGVIVDDSNNVTGMATLTLPNTGLHLLDTNASHDLIIAPGSDVTADRTLTITTGDADRTLTISGNATVNQDYSTSGNPQFATIELGHASDTTIARTGAGDIAVEGNAIYRAGGTDVPVSDGGTGASTARGACANLGTWSLLAHSAVRQSRNSVNGAGDATDQTMATVTVPAGAIGANGCLRIVSLWSMTSSANSKNVKAKFNGTNYLQVTPITTSASAQYFTMIHNRNATNSQVGMQANNSGFGNPNAAVTTSAHDTTGALDITFTCAWAGATAAETISLEAYTVEVFYAA